MGTMTMGPGGRPRPALWLSATRPMMVGEDSSIPGPRPLLMVIWLPMGFWFGQNCLAAAWLMRATLGLVAVANAVKSGPRRSGIWKTLREPGDTLIQRLPYWWFSSVGWPTIWKGRASPTS